MWLVIRASVTGMSADKLALRSIGLNAGGPRLPLNRRIIIARALQQVRRDRLLDPALQQHRLLRPGREHDIIALARRALDHRPRIAGRLGLVDDQRGNRAAPRRLLIFVHPAAVEGHRLAAELAGDRLPRRGLEVGVVDQHHRDLALQVDALEIVPPALRCGHAIADEHHRRVGDGDAVDRPGRAEIDVVGKAQRHRRARLVHRHIHRRLQLRVDHRDFLRPPAVLAGRLEPRRLELLDQIGDRLVLARRARRTPLERVGSEGARDVRHPLHVDMRCSRRRRRGRCCGRRGECGNQPREQR